MDAYKKIFRNAKLRIILLRTISWLPDEKMVEIQYFIKTHRKLNLDNPKRWTEKCQWYKLYYRNPLMTKCADKYLVREYVEEKGLGHTLNELYGCYKNVEDIDFDSLPNEFVIKSTTGSGNNIIVTDKSTLNIEEAKKKIKTWLRPTGKLAKEWAYYDIEPRIIIEKYLSEAKEGLTDYKFFCFSGKVSHLLVISDRFSDEKIDVYDADFKRQDVKLMVCPNQSKEDLPKPENYDEMVRMAEILSKDFPHVRVDFYNINGKIIFGELTFYSGAGYYVFEPDNFDYILGEKFILPPKKWCNVMGEKFKFPN